MAVRKILLVRVVLRFCVVFFYLHIILIGFATRKMFASYGQSGRVLGDPRIDVRVHRSTSLVVLWMSPDCAKITSLNSHRSRPGGPHGRMVFSPHRHPYDCCSLLLLITPSPAVKFSGSAFGVARTRPNFVHFLPIPNDGGILAGALALSPVRSRALGIWTTPSEPTLGICPDNNDWLEGIE